MTTYEKDKSFSMGWVIGGAIFMFIANAFAGVACAIFGVTSIYAMAGAASFCFGACGFFIGWRSEGQTILEAGLAAALATMGAVALLFLRTHQLPNGIGLAIGLVPPFLFGLLGGWIGEKVQGDTIEVE